MPAAAISVTSATASEIERRSIPGIVSIGSRTPSPAVMKRGWTRWSAVRSVSRTRSRSGSVRRRRRSRVAGKLTPVILGPRLPSLRRSAGLGEPLDRQEHLLAHHEADRIHQVRTETELLTEAVAATLRPRSSNRVVPFGPSSR